MEEKMLEKLDLFEVLQVMTKNFNITAVKENGCKIKWTNKPQLKLVFVNLLGEENPIDLTFEFLDFNNHNSWSIIKNE